MKLPGYRLIPFVLVVLITVPAAAQEPEQSKSTGSLTVTVTTGGKPVIGASVEIFKWTGEWEPIDRQAKSTKRGQATVQSLPIGEYMTAVVRASGLAPTMQDFELGEGEARSIKVELAKTVRAWLDVRDENDNPVVGAEIQRFAFTDANKGTVYLNNKTLGTLLGRPGEFEPSDSNGQLILPPLPNGAKVSAWVIHPKWRVARLQHLDAKNGLIGKATMKTGVPVRIELKGRTGTPPDLSHLDGTKADVLFFPKRGGSPAAETIMHRLTIRNSAIEFTAYPVEYRFVRLTLDDYFTTDVPSNEPGKLNPMLDLSKQKSANLSVMLHRKVKTKGRVVGPDGKPIEGVWVSGSILNYRLDGEPVSDAPMQKWAGGGDDETDANGNYELNLIAGHSAVEVIHEGFFPDPSFAEFDVESDGTTKAPTIKLFPVPTLNGRVVDSAGKPFPGAIVRMRCVGRSDSDPVEQSGTGGDFELQMSRIPYKPLGTNGMQTDVFVVAFDPNTGLAGRTAVDLKDAKQTGNITVKLKEHESSWVVNPLADQKSDDKTGSTKQWLTDLKQRNSETRKLYASGLPGQPVPDLSDGTWLNSDAGSLEDFRGKYVLLDFWFIGCGPCHRDMPTVRMAHKVFADQGFSVVSVHTKSQTPDNVQKFADANEMNYPIVVDNTKGDIEAAFRKLGLGGFPHYILIDPEGKIVNNGCFWQPDFISLRLHKLELIYEAIRSRK